MTLSRDGVVEPPRTVDADGVVADLSLREALWPRLRTATVAVLRRYPPRRRATTTDRARWARVQAVSAAIDQGAAEVALYELVALERLAGAGK